MADPENSVGMLDPSNMSPDDGGDKNGADNEEG